jgi:hypothetical protein
MSEAPLYTRKEPGQQNCPTPDELGAEPGAVSGANFGKFLANETTKWTKIIRESGAKVD